MSKFRENLKQELAYKDMRVKELSEKTGISKHTIDHYLAENSSEPLAEAAVKIAQALGVSVEYLVTGENFSFEQTLQKSAMALALEANNLDESEIKTIRQFIKMLRKRK